VARLLVVVGIGFVIVGGVLSISYFNKTEKQGYSTVQKDGAITIEDNIQNYVDEEAQDSSQSELQLNNDGSTNADTVGLSPSSNSNQKPQFRQIKDIKTRKKAFFDFLLPFIREENSKLWKKRQSLLSIRESIVKNKQNDPSILEKLQALAVEHKLDSKQMSEVVIIEQLLTKIDVIPPGLVLAQAANESAWGTSRFAREGNNYFGQWCYKKGCGLIPKSRSKGMKHEVAKFDSAKKSVISYMRNINIHPAYTELRKIRTEKRKNEALLDSVSLAKGLINYSERREAYVREIVEMIKFNKIDSKHPINPNFR
jgi:Bax protein